MNLMEPISQREAYIEELRAENARLRAALEVVIKLRNGSRLYFVLNHHNGTTEELLRPEDKHTDMIVAALRPADEKCEHIASVKGNSCFVCGARVDEDAPAEQPDCDHPFRVTGDVCLNCGEKDEQPGEMNEASGLGYVVNIHEQRIAELEAALTDALYAWVSAASRCS